MEPVEITEVDHYLTDVTVLIYSSKQVRGAWIGHCLDYDIVTQGDNPWHTFELMYEAMNTCIVDDFKQRFDPGGRRPAPLKYWNTE